MATEISICSNALLKLGAPTIASFTESTQSAQLCSNLWPSARDGVLRSHPWNCATRRVTIAPDSGVPTWGYTARFTIPADCLRIMEVEDITDYRIESGKILSNESGINLRYIWRNTNPDTYDVSLVDVMTQRMVSELAYPVTKSSQQQITETNKYSAMLREAKAIDGSEQEFDQFTDYPLIDVRGF